MKQFILKTVGFMLAFALTFASIPATQVQAASKPVISSSQVKINKNSCSVKKGKKIKLTAKYGKKDITKKGTWKSSKKSVASITKTGVLTAKKAGTTYITVKYKGKTSKKLKVVVKANTKPAPKPDDTSGKGFTITYNKNSKNKSDKLHGPAKQKIKTASGEILKFSTTVIPANGKKFLGWYDAKSGGNRIYETYKLTGNMTLYAHYVDDDETTQSIEFYLGCNYGSEKVSFIGLHQAAWNNSYEYPSMRMSRGPRAVIDPDNLMWKHRYFVSDKKKMVLDTLPEPSIPGYTFKGWYTTDLDYYYYDETKDGGTKVKAGQKIGTDVTRLYARFSKKLTISFDDLHGGKYDDIVVDTYSSIEDCGVKLPVPDIPGVIFEGWQVSSSPEDDYGIPIKNDYMFGNLIYNQGWECHYAGECLEPCRDGRAFAVHQKYLEPEHFLAPWGDVEFYEETDHVTLYPRYKIQRDILFEFNPEGGTFSKTSTDNATLIIYTEDTGKFKKGYCYLKSLVTDAFYGSIEQYIPGHDGEIGWKYSANNRNIPFVYRDNYIFDGWIAPDGAKLAEDTWVTGNMTLSAKWIPGNCYVMFDPTDGELTKEERDRVGLDGTWRYKVTTESSVSGSGKQLPVPVNAEGRSFEGWYTKDGKRVDENTQILKDTTLYAHWGTKTDRKPETQKPSTDKDTTANKDTNSTNKNETVYATDITVTDMEWKPVDKNNNKYMIEYGGNGNPTGLGFTATVLPMELKDAARNVIWTSSDPNIISVTAGKEVIYSPNWFDYFEFGTDAGDVVLTVTSMDNSNVSFNINVTVIKK